MSNKVRRAAILLLLLSSCLSELNLGSDWVARRISRRSIESVDWALDRLNEQVRALDGKIENLASGDIYVVGQGVRATHAEFGARVLQGFSVAGGDSQSDCGAGVSTGAASIAIGSNNGIARSAGVIPVKVSCSTTPSTSEVEQGMIWVEDQIASHPSHKAVLLFTFPISREMAGSARLRTLAQRHLVVIPAGDNGVNNCNNINNLDEVGVMVVASSTSSDSQASTSNYGNCIDIWAPGEGVSAASSSDDTAIVSDSGTAFAAAAVAGTAIQNLMQIRESSDVAKLKGVILSRSTKGALTLTASARSAGTPNRLLFDICPFYKRPDYGKCYVAQTKQLASIDDENRLMNRAAKSVVTFDDMAYNYYEDCLTVLVFASSETSTVVTATHVRENERIRDSTFTIQTATATIKLESGPRVKIDNSDADLSTTISGADYLITEVLEEVRTQQDSMRFIPIITVYLENNVTVSFDGHQQIRVELKEVELFREKTQGICGFMDSSHVLEFVDRQGNDMEFTFQENKSKFVKEWKEGDFTCDEGNDNICDESTRDRCQVTAEEVCYPLKDPAGDFNLCFEILESSSWYSNCVDAVKECCCSNVDTAKCSCEEQEKYWWAALLEGCEADRPCEHTCEKPDTDKECLDDAGKEIKFFYTEIINYSPKDNCHYVDAHDEIECKHDGTWNKVPSDCKIKTCDAPDPTALTEFIEDTRDSYNCGDKVGYECTKTPCDCNCYDMTGYSELQCVSNGERTADWSSPPPTCTLKTCDTPRAPTVDKRINQDNLSWVVAEDRSCCSGRATYHCHECYTLAGVTSATCCNDRWGDGSIPQCQLKQCQDPSVAVVNSGDDHLIVTSSGNYCSYEVTYSCDNSCYEIEGVTTRTCQPDGSWSGELPRCVKKKCPVVDGYKDGRYTFNGAPLPDGEILECGDTLNVRCNNCHFPCTSTCERTCRWNGTNTEWSNSAPQCAPILCRQRRVGNAHFVDNPGTLECGESSEMQCNHCYKQVGGNNIRQCTAVPSNDTCPMRHVDGIYTGDEIQCVKLSCPELVLGDNIRIKNNDTCTSECNCVLTFECIGDCYEMEGSATLQCNGEGWDHPVPTCRRRTCPWRQPDFSRNYNYYPETPFGCQFVSHKDGQRVTEEDTFYCGDELDVEARSAECYHVCHKDRLRCQEDGTWNITSYRIPSCVLMECEAPEPVSNATLVYSTTEDNEYNCNTTLTWECNTCHRHVAGDLSRSCVGVNTDAGPEGAWSGQAPVCEPMTCAYQDVPDVANATVTQEDVQCGGKLRYTCNECTELVGDDEVICTHPDIRTAVTSWLNTPPTCQPICCPALEPVYSEDEDYQVISTGAVYKHGVMDPIVCGENYVCQEVEAACDECYEYKTTQESLQYAPTRKCVRRSGVTEDGHSEGYWTNTDRVCTRKECTVDDIPAGNHAHYTSTHSTMKCNQTVEVECDCCHKISPSSISTTLQCLPNKLWDQPLPTCTPITCSTPQDIAHGTYRIMDPDSTSCTCGAVQYECDPCYRLVGSATLTCTQDSGVGTAAWSSVPPVCEPVCCEHLEEPLDELTGDTTTQYNYRKERRPVEMELGEMSVKDNFNTCDKDYVCQTIDPICGPCHEYNNDLDAVTVDGVKQPPTKECVKRQRPDGLEIGEWTNPDKQCTLKKCDYREITDDKHLHYTAPVGYSVNNAAHCMSNVTVTCDECFELSDGSRSQTHTCQKDKTWSLPLPTCQRSECAEPPAVPHCSYTPGEDKCSFTRQLECDECYYENTCKQQSTDGVMRVTCNYDKSWEWAVQEPTMNLRQCEAAPSIEHGTVDSTGSGCGDMARYRCDRCYEFSHDSECLCEKRKCVPDPNDCTRGKWNETAPMCQKITCPRLPDPPSNGRLVSVDSTCDGQVVYDCDEGYYLTDGDLIRNCTEWGRWSGKHPVCSVKKCTEVNASPHRQHFPANSHQYGTVVRFQCEHCYKFHRDFTDESVKDRETIYPRFYMLECEATGNWNGSFPVCQEKRCPNPGIPANGRMTSDPNFQCGSTITYQCLDGYRFTDGSSQSRTCNGEAWSGNAPTCEPIDCGDIEVSNPMRADYIDTLYGYEAIYSCGRKPAQRRCYHQPRPEEAECLEDGTWSVPHPGCVRYQCPAVPHIDNATLHMISGNLGPTDCNQRYRVTCDEGFRLEGPSWIRCDTTSWFPPTLPRCVKLSCTPQGEPRNGQVTPGFEEQRNQIHFGAQLTYTCEPCYELSGAEIRECVLDSTGAMVTWSSLEPTCVPKFCNLPVIANGQISSGHGAYNRPKCGEDISFKCDYGYRRIGSDTATCQPTSTLDTIPPTCQEITCPHPGFRDHMANTTYPADSVYRLHAQIEYECEDGWEMGQGQWNIIACQEDGTWDHPAPQCTPSQCSEPDSILHGTIVTVSDVRRRIECDTCYTPSNPLATELQCRDGQWVPRPPTQCEALVCGDPRGRVAHGIISPGAHYHHTCGTKVTITCEDGFALQGRDTVRCGEDGWESNFPLCLETHCEELEEVENAITTTAFHGRQVNYECKEGYQLYGDAVRRCYNGSQWSGPGATSCKVKHCGDVGDILYGVVSQLTLGLEDGRDTLGASVHYTCNDDRYQLIGESVRTCELNQQWTFAPPVCKCISCPILELLHGRVETADENKVGTSIQYICDPGYKLMPEGANTRTCLESGDWDGFHPTCERVKCKRRVPEGSRIEGVDKIEYEYLETVKFVCEPYKNKLLYTCGENGQWEGDVHKSCSACREERQEVTEIITRHIPPTCILTKCSEPRTIEIPVTKYVTKIVCD